jgi:hypothetical protein
MPEIPEQSANNIDQVSIFDSKRGVFIVEGGKLRGYLGVDVYPSQTEPARLIAESGGLFPLGQGDDKESAIKSLKDLVEGHGSDYLGRGKLHEFLPAPQWLNCKPSRKAAALIISALRSRFSTVLEVTLDSA